MSITNKLFSLLLLGTFSACSAKKQVPGAGVFAWIKTDKGEILAQLEFEKAPLTVMNFVGLAEGRFNTPSSPKGTPYFNGLSFHRVEPNFVIQGGDPEGNGTGGPGYEFPNEIDPSLNHDTEGILSMANAGPDTNGSQFFITLAQASFLNGSYSVFGRVVEGMEVVKKIKKGDKIQTIQIIRKGERAETFQPTWEQFQQLSAKILKDRSTLAVQQSQKMQEALEAFVQKQWQNIRFERSSQDGLMYYIAQEGNGQTGEQTGNVERYQLHYTLWAPGPDGTINKVDSSFDRGTPIEIAPNQVIKAWGITMPQMQLNERRIILVMSELGYGKRGNPPRIQPNSPLLFEMEMVGFVR